MKSKRIMAKSLVFALTLGMFSYMGSESNTTKAAINAAFDGIEGMAKVTVAGDAKYVWGVAKKMTKAPKTGKVKFNQKKLAGTWYEVKTFEDVYGGLIDVNAVAKGKATNILVVDAKKVTKEELESDDFKLLEIAAPDKHFKVVYSADGKGIETGTDNKVVGEKESGYLAFFKSDATGKKAEQFLPTGKDVQLKKGKNGAWIDLEKYFEGGAFTDDKGDARVNVLTQNGAELSFRLKPSTAKPQFVSKEVKVKITKRANAPKVKVDVHKDIVNLKKGMQYKVMLGTEKKAEGTFTDPKKNTFADLKFKTEIEAGDDATKKQIIEISTGAKGKKLASRVATITLDRQTTPFIAKDSKTGNDLKDQGGGVIQDKKEDGGAKPLVNFKLDTAYDPTKGAILENLDTKNDYEFWIAYDGTMTSPKKWLTLKKAKDEDKPTKIKIKSSTSKKEGTFKVDASSESKLHIRLAGDGKSNPTVVKLASAPLTINLKLSKLDQPIKMTKPGTDSAEAVANFDLDFKGATEGTFTLHVDKLVNLSAKPKLVGVKAPAGVTIKAAPFDGIVKSKQGCASTITVSVKEKTLSSINNSPASFKFVVEGVEQEITLTLKNTVS